MSFDVQLSDGDIQLTPGGELVKVDNTSKLVQDVLKALYTTLGEDPFNPSYGSVLTNDSVGMNIMPNILNIQAQEAITDSLELIQQAQAEQKLYQEVTMAETLANIGEITIDQDTTEPRQYNVSLTVLSGELEPITLEFQFHT